MRFKATGAAAMMMGLATLGYARTADADERVMVILDHTGSMGVAGAGGNTRWYNAIEAARTWINDRRMAFEPGTSDPEAFGIWTFKQGDGQDGIEQIWPSNAADCGSSDFVTIEGLRFCVFDTRPEFDMLVGNVLDPGVLTAVHEGDIPGSGLPQPEWLTPLAASLCEGMEALIVASTADGKWVLFESDAGENASSGINECFSSSSTLAPADGWTFNTDAVEEWGYSFDSWQARVVRKLFRFNQSIPAAVADPLPDDADPDGFSSFEEFSTFLASTYNINWAVDVHYEVFPPATTAMSRLASASAASGPVTDMDVTAVINSFSPLARTSASTLAAAALPPPSSVSINLAELSLFRSLGTSTPASQLREFVATPDQSFGMDHALVADVDDSGCSDIADYAIIAQEDVFLQRAELPNELAVRADITRDGWVNFEDLDLLFDHWGEGCLNDVGAPPYPDTCFDGEQTGSETDIDCGGICAACSVDGGCEVETDCDSGVCTSGTCSPASCEDGVLNGAELDVDCGGPDCPACETDFEASVAITHRWNGGYCATLQLSNLASAPTTTWSVVLDMNASSLSSQWNGSFSGSSGEVTVTPVGWNAVIPAQSSNASIGFCANGSGEAFVASAEASY